MPSFGALKITPEAKALIERERGGKYRIKKYTKELENSIWDLRIKTLGKDDIYSHFGDKRETCVIPCHLKDNFVMVYSSDSRYPGDTEAELVPQKDSPWAHFLKRDYSAPKPAAEKEAPVAKVSTEKKPSLAQRLSNAWNALLGNNLTLPWGREAALAELCEA